MPASKIQDRAEVTRWIAEGKTYAWMVERYREKYNLEVTINMFSNFRRRHGLDRRYLRHEDLIPWILRAEHRFKSIPTLLRAEGRRRKGGEISREQEAILDAWIANLKNAGLVVHYDPDTDEGFFTVPARHGIDSDIIRVP